MEKHWPAALKSRIEEIVDHSNLDKFIEETFGREWSLGQNDQSPNDSISYFEVYKDPEATAKVQEWLDSPPASIPGRLNQPGECGWKPGHTIAETVDIGTWTILCEMCNRGILPEGDMTVYVSW